MKIIQVTNEKRVEKKVYFSQCLGLGLVLVKGSIFLGGLGIQAHAATRPQPKSTYMDCQTSSKLIQRVVLKADRHRDVLKGMEVILVDQKGKSQTFQSKETLDGRHLDPRTLRTKHILIVGNSKGTIRENGLIQNGTSVSLFEDASDSEDLSCLSIENRVGQSQLRSPKKVLRRQIRNELRYQKFSGTLHHKDRLFELTCFSPMVPRELDCGLSVGDNEAEEAIGPL
jgi:hypothetical protein